MHLHILGVCGTFMGGIAALARAAGHRVTGSDAGVYPPMSTQLEAEGIALIEGYDPAQLDMRPDVVVVGNVMSRGKPIVERLLDSGLPYTSGPQWLAENVLRGREVAAVAGTHGKTTTSSMLAWILECAGREPGFLIGGVPANFGVTARAGGGPFVIEADEYDTAFFDKRAKFVHYRPRHLLLTNLEYDHADIYPDLASIQRQFHHLVRTVPPSGRITWNAADANLGATLAMGSWTPLAGFAREAAAEWRARIAAEDGSVFEVLHGDTPVGAVRWPLIGMHNVENGLSAVACAAGMGVPAGVACDALARFAGVKRRLELRGEAGGIRVYDDFAHHPTAVSLTIDGLRRQGEPGRIVAVLEPRSNTMRLGVHRDELAEALARADDVWLYQPAGLDWDIEGVAAALGGKARVLPDVPAIVAALAAELRAGDRVVVMSNGGFGGLHERLLAALRSRTA